MSDQKLDWRGGVNRPRLSGQQPVVGEHRLNTSPPREDGLNIKDDL